MTSVTILKTTLHVSRHALFLIPALLLAGLSSSGTCRPQHKAQLSQYTPLPPTTLTAPTQTLALDNGDTTLAFGRGDRRVFLTGITDRARKHEFLRPEAAAAGPLWRIALRPPSGEQSAEVVLDETKASRPTAEVLPDKSQIRFTWTGLAAGAETNAVDIVVTVTKMPATSLTDWRIAVRNRSTTKGVWTVDFP